jgi:hypothetical protein
MPLEMQDKILGYVVEPWDLLAVSMVNRGMYTFFGVAADDAQAARMTGTTRKYDLLGERYLQAREVGRQATLRHRGQGGVLYRQAGASFPQTVSEQDVEINWPVRSLEELGPHLWYLHPEEVQHLKNCAAAIAKSVLTDVARWVSNPGPAYDVRRVRDVAGLLQFEYLPDDTVGKFLSRSAGDSYIRPRVQGTFASMWEHLAPPNRQRELSMAQDELLTAIEKATPVSVDDSSIDRRAINNSRDDLLDLFAGKLVDMSGDHQERWSAMVRGITDPAARDFVIATANSALIRSAESWNDLTLQQRDRLLTAINNLGTYASFGIDLALANKLVDMNAEQQKRWSDGVARLPDDVRTRVIEAADEDLEGSAWQWKNYLTPDRRYGLLRAIANTPVTPVRKFELLMALAPEVGGMTDDQQEQWARMAAEFTGDKRKKLIDAAQKDITEPLASRALSIL